jgi:hypothetical protein
MIVGSKYYFFTTNGLEAAQLTSGVYNNFVFIFIFVLTISRNYNISTMT